MVGPDLIARREKVIVTASCSNIEIDFIDKVFLNVIWAKLSFLLFQFLQISNNNNGNKSFKNGAL